MLSKIHCGDETMVGYIQDLSPLGIGITCNRPLNVKSEIKVTVNLSDLPSMDLPGSIVWRRKLPEASRHKFLYGVRLAEPPKNYIAYIEDEYERIQQRRAEMRIRYSVTVRGSEILKIVEASTEDISPKGLYISTRELLEVGKEYAISLEDEQLATPILCMGQIISCFECDAKSYPYAYGAGVKLISFNDKDEERFRTFIRFLNEARLASG